MHDSMLDLDGLSPVIGKAVFARFDGGQLQTVFHAKAIVHMLDPSDTVVFSGARTCGILVS
jgi:hypothetical protein